MYQEPIFLAVISICLKMRWVCYVLRQFLSRMIPTQAMMNCGTTDKGTSEIITLGKACVDNKKNP